MNEAQRLLDILSALRVPPQPEEYEIHDMVSAALSAAGAAFVHECRLAPGGRIDFLCGKTGIEIKKGRPDAARLKRQLERYLQSDMLESVIVVLQKPCRLPAEICGKSVYTLALNRLWGVALP